MSRRLELLPLHALSQRQPVGYVPAGLADARHLGRVWAAFTLLQKAADPYAGEHLELAPGQLTHAEARAVERAAQLLRT